MHNAGLFFFSMVKQKVVCSSEWVHGLVVQLHCWYVVYYEWLIRIEVRDPGSIFKDENACSGRIYFIGTRVSVSGFATWFLVPPTNPIHYPVPFQLMKQVQTIIQCISLHRKFGKSTKGTFLTQINYWVD